jgi:hypothetical protein
MERKFDYFVEQTNHRLDKIDEKLDQLISFRVMMIGASMAVATLFSLATTLITLFLSR